MNTEAFIALAVGTAVTIALSAISWLLKSLITEFRETHEKHSEQIIEILQRLVRLEERNQMNMRQGSRDF